MSRFVDNPKRTVLCVGYIGDDRYERMKRQGISFEQYKERLRFLYRILAIEGYATYIYTTWGNFELMAASMLQLSASDILKDIGHQQIYSLAVFDDNRSILETPPHFNYFNEVIVPQDDDGCLTADDVFDDILSNVSVVLYDNDDRDPVVQSILGKAFVLNKRMININFIMS